MIEFKKISEEEIASVLGPLIFDQDKGNSISEKNTEGLETLRRIGLIFPNHINEKNLSN